MLINALTTRPTSLCPPLICHGFEPVETMLSLRSPSLLFTKYWSLHLISH